MRRKAARRIAPEAARVAEAVAAIRAAKRPLVVSGRGARGAGAALVAVSRRGGRALPRHPGKPRPGAVRTSRGRRRGARRGDGAGRPGDHPRAQARLPARLRLAGGLSRRALRAHRRHARRTDRQPARHAGDRWRRVDLALDAITDALGNDAGSRDERLARRAARQAPRADREGRRRPAPQTGGDGKIHPLAIFEAHPRGRRSRPHRGRRRRRPAELRPRRPVATHLPRRRRLRLPRRRRAVRDRRRAGLSGPAGDLGHRRRRLRHQRDGDRHRRAPRREGGLHRLQQRRLEHRALRPGSSTTAAASSAPRCAIPTMPRWRAALGAHGERVEDPADLADAIRRGARQRAGGDRRRHLAAGGVVRRAARALASCRTTRR